jgi:hypothetical protein
VTKPKFKSVEQEILHHFVIGEKLSPIIGLSEESVRGRVIMLKRMRRLLIIDWHPIIDILLGDYERDLKRVEALRENDDEPDVQDRDF